MIPIVIWFEEGSETLVCSTPLTEATLSDLQQLFGLESDNPMYDSYPVQTLEQIRFIESRLEYQLNLYLYEYFIEYSD